MENPDYVGVAVCTLVMGVVFWNLVLLRRGIGLYDERPESVWQAILAILAGTTTPPIGLFFGFMAGILLDLWSGTPGLFIVVGLMLLSFVVAASAVLTGRPRWVVPPPVRPWPGARRIDAGEVYPSPDSAALDANQTL